MAGAIEDTVASVEEATHRGSRRSLQWLRALDVLPRQPDVAVAGVCLRRLLDFPDRLDVGVLVDGRLDAVEAPEHTWGW